MAEMVQYDLTEEQRMLQDMVRKMAKEQVEPGAAKRDEEAKFSWEMVKLLAENGRWASISLKHTAARRRVC